MRPVEGKLLMSFWLPRKENDPNKGTQTKNKTHACVSRGKKQKTKRKEKTKTTGPFPMLAAPRGGGGGLCGGFLLRDFFAHACWMAASRAMPPAAAAALSGRGSFGFCPRSPFEGVSDHMAVGQNPKVRLAPSERDRFNPTTKIGSLKWAVNSPTPTWYHGF